MNSETIIAGLCCLFLVIVFFLFKPQFFILLNHLAKLEFRGTKNLQYMDQDFEPEPPNTNQDFRPELPILSWLALTREKFTIRIVIFVILSTIIYIVFASFSGILIQLGNAEFSAGNEKLGITSYNLALEFDRELKRAVNQCYVYDAEKQYELAINHCSKAIEINKNYAAAYASRGYAYLNLKQYDQAIADFTKDIEIIPIATRSYINRGSVYMQQGKYDLAVDDFTKSIDINPKEPQAWLNRGLSYIQQGQNDLAIIDYNKAIYLSPSNQAAFLTRGSIFEAQGKHDLAIADYTKAIEIDSNNSLAYSTRGNIYAILKKYDLAISDLSKAIEIDSKNVNAYIWRGNAFADTKKFTRAIADYQRALVIATDSTVISYTYCVQGITYIRMGNFESAITSLEQGVKLNVTSENDWCRSALENARQEIPAP